MRNFESRITKIEKILNNSDQDIDEAFMFPKGTSDEEMIRSIREQGVNLSRRAFRKWKKVEWFDDEIIFHSPYFKMPHIDDILREIYEESRK